MIKQMVRLDWRAMKCYHPRIILLPVIALAAGYITPLYVIPVNVVMCLFFSVNTFALEEKDGLNKLYLTLPVSRSSVVAGRYALSVCMGLAGMITGIPLAVLADRFTLSHYYGTPGWFLPIVTISYLLFSLFSLFMFPILFRLGYSKGKFWGMLVPLFLFILLYNMIYVISYWPGNEKLIFNALQYAHRNTLLINGGITAIATFILFLSFLLSERIYLRRDF